MSEETSPWIEEMGLAVYVGPGLVMPAKFRLPCDTYDHVLGALLIAFMRTKQAPRVTASPAMLIAIARCAQRQVALEDDVPSVTLYTIAGRVTVYEDMALDGEALRFVEANRPNVHAKLERLAELNTQDLVGTLSGDEKQEQAELRGVLPTEAKVSELLVRVGRLVSEPSTPTTWEVDHASIISDYSRLMMLEAIKRLVGDRSERPRPRAFDRPASDRWLVDEPGRSIVEHLNGMAAAIVNYTGHRGIALLSLTTQVGLMLGIAPGTSIAIATTAGSVEVYCERSAETPR